MQNDSTNQGRTLVVCYDGTTNQFDQDNTNVVKLFSTLRKDSDRQLCYYHTGLGTFFQPGVVRPALEGLARLADSAIAWYLESHVMDGYKFIMQNYRENDRICLFGFSRGAYTARALAGMLSKVGLLSKDNFENVTFAWRYYARGDKVGCDLAAGFKKAFARDVKIDFVGVWDTVASVGIVMGRSLPFTDSNTSIKVFRHALSLDEHRSRFRPNVFHRSEPKAVANAQGAPNAQNQEASGAETDVLEVWFSGTHCDVGGGNLLDTAAQALSKIPLRWMIREVIKSNCGIQFDDEALQLHGIPSTKAISATGVTAEEVSLNGLDAVQLVNDELRNMPKMLLWWLLEIVPMHFSWQDNDDKWHTEYNIHMGRGRKLIDPSPKFHISVKQRMEDRSLNYTPKAKWTPGTETYVD